MSFTLRLFSPSPCYVASMYEHSRPHCPRPRVCGRDECPACVSPYNVTRFTPPSHLHQIFGARASGPRRHIRSVHVIHPSSAGPPLPVRPSRQSRVSESASQRGKSASQRVSAASRESARRVASRLRSRRPAPFLCQCLRLHRASRGAASPDWSADWSTSSDWSADWSTTPRWSLTRRAAGLTSRRVRAWLSCAPRMPCVYFRRAGDRDRCIIHMT